MAWRYYRTQLALMVRNRKNLLVMLLTLLAAGLYLGHFDTATLPAEAFDPRVVRTEIETLKSGRDIGDVGRSALRFDEGLMASYDRGGDQRAKALKAKLLQQDQAFHKPTLYSYPTRYYLDHSPGADPVRDGHFGNARMLARLQTRVALEARPVTLTWFNERTFCQSLQRLSARWLPWTVIALCVLLAADVVVADWRHETLTGALPLRLGRRLRLKALATLTLVGGALLLALAVLAVGLIPRFGLGLGSGVASYTGVKFNFIVLAQSAYFWQLAGLLALISWVTIRLVCALQLALRHAGLAVAAAGLLFASPLVYAARDWGLQARWPAWLPVTYTAVGRVLAGTERFWASSPALDGAHAAWVWGLWGLAVEGLLWGLTRREEARG